jgi:hypothetical protein
MYFARCRYSSDLDSSSGFLIMWIDAGLHDSIADSDEVCSVSSLKSGNEVSPEYS